MINQWKKCMILGSVLVLLAMARPAWADSCGVMELNHYLSPETGPLNSCDGRFGLVMQPDGNLVLYWNGHGALWHTATYGTAAYFAVMQGDGNFVLYDYFGFYYYFATWTQGNPGARLHLQDDGNLVVERPIIQPPYWVPIWNSGTCCH